MLPGVEQEFEEKKEVDLKKIVLTIFKNLF